MNDNENFAVNDFEHLNENKRESSGWGLVREDLVKYKVLMLTDVQFVWDESTPPEMRLIFAQAAHVLHHIAETAITRQLEHDGLTPTSRTHVVTGDQGDGDDHVEIILRKFE